MRVLARQLLLTLAYTDQFNFPLKTREILERVWGVSALPREEVLAAFHYLIESGFCCCSNGYWSLNSDRNASTNGRQLREQRAQLSQEKIQAAAGLLKFLAFLPWVCGVAVTGSTAMNSADADDDLDFLIVTQTQRLWLVRPLVILFAMLAGKRRTWQKEEPNSWCFNLWLERDQLAQPLRTRSLYTAYEVVQANWILDRDGCEESFRTANNWVHGVLPFTAPLPASRRRIGRSKSSVPVFAELAAVGATVATSLLAPILSSGNVLSYLAQRAYMQGHKTTERVSIQAAFFHPRDTKRTLYDGLRNSLAELLRKDLAKAEPVVLVTGVFDTLHSEHLQFLSKAKALGGRLLVGVESDLRVRKLKGEGRPINSQAERVAAIERLRVASSVFVLPEQFSKPADHRQLLKKLHPTILAVSSHTAHQTEKAALMNELGGRVVVVHQHNSAVSTTKIVALQNQEVLPQNVRKI